MLNLLKEKKIIGVIHLLPTCGHDGFVNIQNILDKALFDLNAFEKGGVDAIIIENNYDLPHEIKVGAGTTSTIGYVIGKIKEKTKIPLGVSVLWNDYESALTLAKIYNCDFVRVPVFVDSVKTSFGEIKGEPERVIEFRKRIIAQEIKVFTDIQVKHSELLNRRPIEEAAKEAIEKGTDGLIVTGKWTGNAPLLRDLEAVKKVSRNKVPVIIGSGADKNNILSLLNFADAAIVSTALKEGENKSEKEERNIKSFSERIDVQKVKEFMQIVRS
jgi:membrane complex biogenesis BtpA family protein